MFGLAKLAVRHPLSSAALASALILASSLPIRLLPLLGMPIAVAMLVASASLCSLTMLRFGTNSGLLAMGAGVAALAVVGVLSPQIGASLSLTALLFWVPAGVGAYVLRRTVKLDLALAALGLLAALALIALYLLYPDQSQLWGEPVERAVNAFRTMLEQAKASQGSVLDAKRLAELETVRQLMTTYMTPFTIVSFLLIATLALIQARYWQAKLFNPGGFQQEFHALRFGRTMAIVGLIICIAATLFGWAPVVGLSFLVICLFTYQGLAVVHSMVKAGKLAQGWLIGVYVLLLVLQTTVVLAAALGLLDNWLNFAKRPTNSGQT